ncbi:MAG: hypothetical protein AB3N63_09430 [Puniceicoccaceae bacterium]
MSADLQLHEDFSSDLGEAGLTPPGWSSMTGDGEATISFEQKDGFASVEVDASQDRLNIWWAVVRRPVTGLDIDKLMQPGKELRVTARIRSSHAPRRVNLHFNHQRTTDFHSHLMEYDIPEAGKWHSISMTTQGFDVQPGDQVAAQMALMDWGTEVYNLDIESFKIEIVPANAVSNDLGNPMPYHPKLPPVDAFQQHVRAAASAVVDTRFPDLNFKDWQSAGKGSSSPVLAVGSTQITILRWDLEHLRNISAKGPAILELAVDSVQRSPGFNKDFGMVRVVEILDGDPVWKQESVTLNSLCSGKCLNDVLNGQMVIDSELPEDGTGSALFSINPQVIQRLISGRTKGLAILPLGAIQAAFHSNKGTHPPRLHIGLPAPSDTGD